MVNKKNKAMRWFLGFSILFHCFILLYFGKIILSHKYLRRIEVELKQLASKGLKNIPRPRRINNIKPKSSSKIRLNNPQTIKRVSYQCAPKAVNNMIYNSNIVEPISMTNFSSVKDLYDIPMELPDNLDRTKEELDRYRQIVWQAINNNLKYPLIARKRGIKGDIEVEFIVDREGKVLTCNIIKSSGYNLLDSAGLESIKEVKLPPLPYVIKEDTYSMAITLKYRLNS